MSTCQKTEHVHRRQCDKNTQIVESLVTLLHQQQLKFLYLSFQHTVAPVARTSQPSFSLVLSQFLMSLMRRVQGYKSFCSGKDALQQVKQRSEVITGFPNISGTHILLIPPSETEQQEKTQLMCKSVHDTLVFWNSCLFQKRKVWGWLAFWYVRSVFLMFQTIRI